MNVVVTGSSTGIGRAITEHLLARGDSVWGLARSPQDELASQHPGRFFHARCDVSDWVQVAAVAEQVGRTWSAVDGVVAAAGIQGCVGPAVSVNPLEWSATVRVNLDGTFFAIRAFHPLLQRAQGRAKVVCFSGGGATKSRANFSAYGAAKTAIVRLVETLADELQGSPIDLNAVAPGAINTRLTDEVIAMGPERAGKAEYEAALKQKQTGGASLEKAVGLVVYLLSSKSDGVSGRLISAPWDPWQTLGAHAAALAPTDVYTLRRILPEERKLTLD